MTDIPAMPREEIIEAEYVMPFPKQPFTKMRSDEAGSSGNEDTFYAG